MSPLQVPQHRCGFTLRTKLRWYFFRVYGHHRALGLEDVVFISITGKGQELRVKDQYRTWGTKVNHFVAFGEADAVLEGDLEVKNVFNQSMVEEVEGSPSSRNITEDLLNDIEALLLATVETTTTTPLPGSYPTVSIPRYFFLNRSSHFRFGRRKDGCYLSISPSLLCDMWPPYILMRRYISIFVPLLLSFLMCIVLVVCFRGR